MKKLLTALLLIVPAFANAYSTTWEETIDFNPNPQITTNKSYTFTHDLSDNGFTAGTDLITGYKLTVNVFDNSQYFFDSVYIDQPGILGDATSLFWSYASVTTGWSYQGLASLNTNGQLEVTISSLLGSFYLDSSTLQAWGEKASVPEPSSVALLAAGLLGIVVMRRAARNERK